VADHVRNILSAWAWLEDRCFLALVVAAVGCVFTDMVDSNY